MALSLILTAFLSCSIFTFAVSAWQPLTFAVAATKPEDPTVECVVAEDKLWFSVVINDKKDIDKDTKMKVDYDGGGTGKTCEQSNLKIKQGSNKDVGIYEKPLVDTILEMHTHTRVMIPLKDCSHHAEEFVPASPDNKLKATMKQVFTANLHMGPNDWLFETTYALKCSFTQTTEDEDLTISNNAPTPIEAERAPKAKLKLYTCADSACLEDKRKEVTTNPTVNLGVTLLLEAGLEGDMEDFELETAFKFCKICPPGDCKRDLIQQYKGGTALKANEQLNCLHDDIKAINRFKVNVPTDSEKLATFQFPAFRFADATELKNLVLKCAIAICKKSTGDKPCREKCNTEMEFAVKPGRRRRSAEVDPLEAEASLTLNIMIPPAINCTLPTPVPHAATRALCTRGSKLGSVCQQQCDRGFESAGGRSAATRVCQESITEKIGNIYYGVVPKWNPEETSCNDINECVESPCPASSICENTIGSYRCM